MTDTENQELVDWLGGATDRQPTKTMILVVIERDGKHILDLRFTNVKEYTTSDIPIARNLINDYLDGIYLRDTPAEAEDAPA
jgi:hypothetical protein